MVPWSCAACTLENEASRTACEVCGTARPGTWACSGCTLQNDGAAPACAACGAPRSRAPPRQSKRGEVWHTANHLLGQPAPRPKPEVRARPGPRPTPQRALKKGEYVQGACRLVLSTETGKWQHVEHVDLQCHELPACPICLDIPERPRLTECGHAFCLECALQLLGNTQACPVCTTRMCLEDLRPVRFEPVEALSTGELVAFQLVRREGSWIGPAEERPRAGDGALCREGDAGSLFARRVLADPARRVARLHAELKEVESLGSASSAAVKGLLERLRARLLPVEAEASAAALVNAAPRRPVAPAETMVFYQSGDGQLVFFEAHLTKRLLARHGTWAALPPLVQLRLRSLRTEALSDELRRRHRFLAHLLAGEVTFADGVLADEEAADAPGVDPSGGGAWAAPPGEGVDGAAETGGGWDETDWRGAGWAGGGGGGGGWWGSGAWDDQDDADWGDWSGWAEEGRGRRQAARGPRREAGQAATKKPSRGRGGGDPGRAGGGAGRGDGGGGGGGDCVGGRGGGGGRRSVGGGGGGEGHGQHGEVGGGAAAPHDGGEASPGEAATTPVPTGDAVPGTDAA